MMYSSPPTHASQVRNSHRFFILACAATAMLIADACGIRWGPAAAINHLQVATACTCGRISTRPRRGVFLCAANRRRAFTLCWAIGQIGLRPCCWCPFPSGRIYTLTYSVYDCNQKTPLRMDDSCVLQCVRRWFARPLHEAIHLASPCVRNM